MGIAAAVPVDTYEVNSVPVESEDALAEFRQQVKADDGRAKMSEAAKAKLRSLNEHDRANTQADARLVEEFNSRPWTLEQIMDLFAKAFGGCTMNPRRRAVKALHCLAQGMHVYHIHDLSLFGELLPDEVGMPMVRFLSRYPLPEDGIVTPKGEPEKPIRRCKAGKKCLRFEKRKPAPAKGSGDYCSTACAASDRARNKRASVVIPTVQ